MCPISRSLCPRWWVVKSDYESLSELQVLVPKKFFYFFLQYPALTLNTQVSLQSNNYKTWVASYVALNLTLRNDVSRLDTQILPTIPMGCLPCSTWLNVVERLNWLGYSHFTKDQVINHLYFLSITYIVLEPNPLTLNGDSLLHFNSIVPYGNNLTIVNDPYHLDFNLPWNK